MPPPIKPAVADTAAPEQIEGVLHFPEGLPGFENLTLFVLIQDKELLPVVFLTSVAEPRIPFPVVPVRCLVSDYDLRMGEADQSLLGLGEPAPVRGIHSEVLCLAILNLGQGEQPVTANLFAPVVINTRNRKGKQVIQLDSSYSAVFEV